MKKNSKNNTTIYNRIGIIFVITTCLILIGLLSMRYILARYNSYLNLQNAISKINVHVTQYTLRQSSDEDLTISTNHSYFLVSGIEEVGLDPKMINVKSEPKITLVLEKKPSILGQFSYLSESDSKILLSKLDAISESQGDQRSKVFQDIKNFLKRNPSHEQLVLVRKGASLLPNTKYSIQLSLNSQNFFTKIFGDIQSQKFKFVTSTDTTDQEQYEIAKMKTQIQQLVMTDEIDRQQREQKENCPFRMSDAIQVTQFFKLIDGSQCDTEKANQIEHPNVEIYTQNFEEGKQKFREMSLAPIGLSEGPRLRVNYIHKPGGYISPTPTQ